MMRFFGIYSQWKWPTPIVLSGSLGARPWQGGKGAAVHHPPVWNPAVNRADALHLMPVLTPVYPAANCTYAICRSNLDALRQELRRGANMVLNARQAQRVFASKELFERAAFFRMYPFYLQVRCFPCCCCCCCCCCALLTVHACNCFSSILVHRGILVWTSNGG